METNAQEKRIDQVKTETEVGEERQAALLAWFNAGQEVQRLERNRNNGVAVSNLTMRQAYAIHAAAGDALRRIGQ